MGDYLNTCDANVFETESSALDVTQSYEEHISRPQYKTSASRRQTFRNWPSNTGQTPQNLAEAGFYSTGKDDEVCCFYCNMKVWRWQPGDSPWSEHVRLDNTCRFVQQSLGDDKIKAILSSLDTKTKQDAFDNLTKLGHSEDNIACAVQHAQGAGTPTERQVTKAVEYLHGAQGSSGYIAGMCISCSNSKAHILFLPCKHTVSCNKCAERVDNCFKCGSGIKQKKKVYLC